MVFFIFILFIFIFYLRHKRSPASLGWLFLPWLLRVSNIVLLILATDTVISEELYIIIFKIIKQKLFGMVPKLEHIFFMKLCHVEINRLRFVKHNQLNVAWWNWCKINEIDEIDENQNVLVIENSSRGIN